MSKEKELSVQEMESDWYTFYLMLNGKSRMHAYNLFDAADEAFDKAKYQDAESLFNANREWVKEILSEGVNKDEIMEAVPNAPRYMNTKMRYLYRDASNYKKGNSIVLEGTFSEEQISRIYASLSEGEYFIPRQVGLPEERFRELTEDDHCWFELSEDREYAFEPTAKKPTIDISPEELTRAFEYAAGNWDDVGYAIVA